MSRVVWRSFVLFARRPEHPAGTAQDSAVVLRAAAAAILWGWTVPQAARSMSCCRLRRRSGLRRWPAWIWTGSRRMRPAGTSWSCSTLIGRSCFRGLDPSTSAAAAAEVASLLARPARASQWADLLSCAAQHRPVLVHGDIHGDQMLADGGRLTGIIDWETARVDRPFWDFDVGPRGSGLWRRRREFSALLRRAWRAYARVGAPAAGGPASPAKVWPVSWLAR
jgi:hypothetical protein